MMFSIDMICECSRCQMDLDCEVGSDNIIYVTPCKYCSDTKYMKGRGDGFAAGHRAGFDEGRMGASCEAYSIGFDEGFRVGDKYGPTKEY